ncbi:hypothetical protein AAW14_01125 [Streptomyces hygroscopicus]|uniref:hypothetical protein n=1 Tax=Streptomyces hygroscopicus TaxID=1912 RepID=UPI00223EDFCD|nr:hypothetical protein [Streptomyces hygroscopicus]MCW7940669.1 hypothetical protein [Streptomyces hygroscopicus]
MLGRTLLAAALVATALTAPAALPDADAAALSRVTLTNGDDGRTISVHTGDEITVRLKGIVGDGEMWRWSVPKSSAPAVLRQIAGGTSPNGDSQAVFRVSGVGTSDITAQKACQVTRPGHMCPHIVTRWKVTVGTH